MGFFYYDFAFLVIFSIIVGAFLYRNRKKLQIESKILLLYRTKFGLGFIEKVSSKAPWLMRGLATLSIVSGFFLMAGAVFFLIQAIIAMGSAVTLPKIPPLMPLVPYLPSIFKIKFLPPFYFTYWIISIAIVAISHEFMHGVFARFYNIKLKSTGFGFLGPFLAAFVEPDEKEMSKKPAKNQMAILAGGSFANLIMAILFFLLLGCFFVSAYAPTGVSFNMYTMKNVNLSDISEINGKSVNLTDYMSFVDAVKETNTGELTLTSGEETYITTNDTVFLQEKILENNKEAFERRILFWKAVDFFLDSDELKASIKVMGGIKKGLGKTVAFYTDTPAYRAKLDGAILSIEDKSTTSLDELSEALSQFKPGQNVTIKTTSGNYSIILAENPENSSKAYIGIGFAQTGTSRLVEWFTSFSLFKKKAPFVYYAPKYDAFYGDLTIFIYNLLLWVLLINVSVMFVNMLPLGIFDGGKFFYLTVLAITKSKRKAMKGFKIAGSIILFILLLLMVIWFFKAF